MLKRGVVTGDDDLILVPYLRDFWKADSTYARAKALRGQELSPRYVALCAGAGNGLQEQGHRLQGETELSTPPDSSTIFITGC